VNGHRFYFFGEFSVAKAKPAASAKVPEPKPVEKASKAKVGPVTREVIAQGVAKLKKAVTQLEALSAQLEERKMEEITLEGPKLLPRGVNSVSQFVFKLDGALQRLDRM